MPPSGPGSLDPSEGAASAKRGLTLALCFLAATIEGIDFQIMALAVPPMAAEWRVAPSAFALTLSLGSVGTAIGTVGIGAISDRLGRKWGLVASQILLGILTALVGRAPDIASVAALRLASGICLGGTLVSVISIASDISAPQDRHRNTMVVYIGVPAGGLAASLLGGYLLGLSDWRIIFLVGSAIAIAMGTLLAALLSETRVARPRVRVAETVESETPSGSVFSPAYLWTTLALCAAQLVSLMAIILLLSWLPTIIAKITGSASQASFYTSAIYLGAIVGVLMLAAVVKRIGAQRVLIVGFLIAAAACIGIDAVLQRPGPLLTGGLVLLGMFLVGGQMALVTLGAALYPAALRGWGSGLAMASGRIGSLAGPLLGAALLSAPRFADRIFIVLGALVALAAVLVAALARSQTRRPRAALP
jgi:MFS family permease